MPRTGSIASNVGPAVTSTRLPGEELRLARGDRPRRRSPRAPACGPSPVSPQAWSPLAGPRIATPSARELRDVALRGGVVPHLRGSSPARPAAGSRARGTAWTAGRRRGRARAWRGSRRWPARRRSRRRRARGRCAPCRCRRARSHRSVSTGLPDSACSVTGVMKRQAAAVITTSTRDAGLDEAGARVRRPCRRRCRRSGRARCGRGERQGRSSSGRRMVRLLVRSLHCPRARTGARRAGHDGRGGGRCGLANGTPSERPRERLLRAGRRRTVGRRARGAAARAPAWRA